MENKESFLIIDGNSIMNRAFYGIRLLTTKDGTFTNAVYGFLNVYYMMLDKLNPNYVAVAFDLSAPTFRHKMYEEYKAGRHSMPEELRPQMLLIKDVLKAMNVPILEIEGYEADDILGTVSRSNSEKNIFTYVLTGDRDSLQLVTEMTNVVMPLTKAGKTEYTIFTPDVLKETYGITAKQVIDIKALMGDKSDNIPGVPKVGEKTTSTLLEKYNNLDYIYDNLDTLDINKTLHERLKENKNIAYLSKELATIKLDIPIVLDYAKLKFSDVNLPELSKIFTRLSFKRFLDKYVTDETLQDIHTDSETEFYLNLSKTNFVYLTSTTDAENVLSNNKATSISFIYLDNTFSYDKFKNVLLFKTNNDIYMIRLDKIIVKSVLESFCGLECEKVGYDIKKLLKLALDNNIENIYGFNEDIMIAYYLVNATDNNYSIQNIVYNLLDINFPELVKDKLKDSQTNIFDAFSDNKDENTNLSNLTDDEKKYIYTSLKAINLCKDKLNEKMLSMNLIKLYKEIEIPLIETLAKIESNGMHIDVGKLKDFATYLESKITELTKKIYELAGEEFNINSPAQLGNILFNKLGLPYAKKNKTNYSTDKEVLESLIEKHEIVKYILEYRTLAKLKSTYTDGLISNIDKNGRIHTTFMQAVTATGRLSSVEPNLQNIPVRTEIGSKIRECFTCENANNVIIDADYSQIELRVLADMSQDPNMIVAYNNNIDIHTITASQVFGIPVENVTKELRSKAKAVNFGIVYGISDYGLAKNINSTRAEAKEYIENYFKHYKNIETYMKELVKIGLETGYAETKYGRKRNVPELKSANHNTKMFGERIAMNMPIQGTAADIIKIAMNKLYSEMKSRKLKSKLVMQVHDELIVEATNDEIETIKELMKNSMENAAKLAVPLIVDINVGDSWMDAK